MSSGEQASPVVLIYGPVVIVHKHRPFSTYKAGKCGLYHGSPGESGTHGSLESLRRKQANVFSRLASGAWGGYRARPVLWPSATQDSLRW